MSTPWTPLGPAPIEGDAHYSGRATSLAFDPTTSGAGQVIYLGTAGGGVWKTTNGGGHWIPLTDEQPSLAIGAVALDPDHPEVVLAGTGEPNMSLDSYYGEGILRSIDGGVTWSLTAQAQLGFRLSAVSRIVFDPNVDGLVWAATTKGLLESTDDGVTWSFDPTLPPDTPIDDLVVDSRTTPATRYAAVRGQGVYKHQAGTWSKLAGGLPPDGDFTVRSALALAPSNPDVVYLLVVGPGGEFYDPGTYNGLYFTTDAGAQWQQGLAMTSDMASFGNEHQGGYDIVLAVDPLDDGLLYVGGIELAHATNARGTAADGGWEQLTLVFGYPDTGIHEDYHALVFTPGCTVSPCGFALATDGGIFAEPAPPGGPFTTAVDLNADLDTGELIGGDVGPDYPGAPLLVGGLQDNGTVRYTGPATPSAPQPWKQSVGADGGQPAIDWHDPNVVLTQLQEGIVLRSTDGGVTFPNATAINGASFYGPLVGDRVTAGHFLFGAQQVWESVDGGVTWHASSPSFGNYPRASALVVDPTNSSVVYAGLNEGDLWRTSNANTGAAATWAPVFGLPWGSARVNSIAVDPADPTVLVAGVGSFPAPSEPMGVYRSTDGGSTWTDATGDLPPLPVNALVVYRSGATRVTVAGTDSGVWSSLDDGAHWTELADGMPNVVVADLVLDGTGTTLVAFTHGRGVWWIPASVAGPPVTTTSTTTSTTTASTTTTAVPAASTTTDVVPISVPGGGSEAAAVSSGPVTGSLPATGADPWPTAIVGLVSVVVGLVAVAVARRRRARGFTRPS